jgi:hypothetical protein
MASEGGLAAVTAMMCPVTGRGLSRDPRGGRIGDGTMGPPGVCAEAGGRLATLMLALLRAWAGR